MPSKLSDLDNHTVHNPELYMDENQGGERKEVNISLLYYVVLLSLSLSIDKSYPGLFYYLVFQLPCRTTVARPNHQRWINERFVKPAVVWLKAVVGIPVPVVSSRQQTPPH